MQIALFGATGGTGREFLDQALAAGHSLSALVRDPARLAPRPGLRVVAGDVLDPAAVAECLAGAEAVVCILGSRPGSEPVEARGTAVLLPAMQAAGVRRLLAVTSLGVGESRRQVNPLFRLVMDFSLKAIMQAKDAQERLIAASDLDWTIVRPGGLTEGPRTGRYRYGTDPSLKAGRVSRADVADFLLAQLTDSRFLRQRPAVT